MRCYLHILHGPEGSEELPKNVLLSFRRQIVDEDAPAGAVGGHAGQESVAGQQVARQGREPKHDSQGHPLISWQSDRSADFKRYWWCWWPNVRESCVFIQYTLEIKSRLILIKLN